MGLVWLAVACQKTESAKTSVVAQNAPSRPAPGAIAPQTDPDRVAAPAPVTATPTPAMAHDKGAACGCAGGMESCSGGCGDSCAGNGPTPQWAPVGADATWQPLYVDGMKCGGCAKRIEKALANVDGVIAVKADFRTKKVEIVTKPGVDARSLVKPTIDGLGYTVQ